MDFDCNADLQTTTNTFVYDDSLFNDELPKYSGGDNKKKDSVLAASTTTVDSVSNVRLAKYSGENDKKKESVVSSNTSAVDSKTMSYDIALNESSDEDNFEEEAIPNKTFSSEEEDDACLFGVTNIEKLFLKLFWVLRSIFEYVLSIV